MMLFIKPARSAALLRAMLSAPSTLQRAGYATDDVDLRVPLGDPQMETEEQRRISRENREISKQHQVKHMRQLAGDKPLFRDPDPYTGINTAGTATGTIEEFEQGQHRRLNEGGLQDRGDYREKEEYAASIGYDSDTGKFEHEKRAEAAEASKPVHPKDFPEGTMVNPYTGKPDLRHGEDSCNDHRTWPEVVGQRARQFVKEAADTLVHGVNNLGNPKIQEKLKDP